jgi:hypothetical protein
MASWQKDLAIARHGLLAFSLGAHPYSCLRSLATFKHVAIRYRYLNFAKRRCNLTGRGVPREFHHAKAPGNPCWIKPSGQQAPRTYQDMHRPRCHAVVFPSRDQYGCLALCPRKEVGRSCEACARRFRVAGSSELIGAWADTSHTFEDLEALEAFAKLLRYQPKRISD